MSLVTPPNKEGRSDAFIDDLTTVFLDIPSNETRSPAAPLLAMHLIGRPVAADEPLPRLDFYLGPNSLPRGPWLKFRQFLVGW
jgi:hypothetical protein